MAVAAASERSPEELIGAKCQALASLGKLSSENHNSVPRNRNGKPPGFGPSWKAALSSISTEARGLKGGTPNPDAISNKSHAGVNATEASSSRQIKATEKDTASDSVLARSLNENAIPVLHNTRTIRRFVSHSGTSETESVKAGGGVKPEKHETGKTENRREALSPIPPPSDPSPALTFTDALSSMAAAHSVPPELVRATDGHATLSSAEICKEIEVLPSPTLRTTDDISSLANATHPHTAILAERPAHAESVPDRDAPNGPVAAASDAVHPSESLHLAGNPIMGPGLESRTDLRGHSTPRLSASITAESVSASANSKAHMIDTHATTQRAIPAAPAAEIRRSSANDTSSVVAKRSLERGAAQLPDAVGITKEAPHVPVIRPIQNTSVQLEPNEAIPISAHPIASSAGAGPAAVPGAGERSSLDQALMVMDAATELSGPQWVHAGMRRAEAGFEDPALGWIGVRAQLDASGVHAALVPGSAAAAQSLGSHLAGLNTYLVEHHAPVDSLTLEAPLSRVAEQGIEMSLSSGDPAAQRVANALGGSSRP